MKIGLLTSGGDCAGLNAVMRGFGKTIYTLDKGAELYGITDGYAGLVNGEWRKMDRDEFSGILTLGGTILGTSRLPYKKLITEGADKIDAMKANYKKMGLDALVVLGGNGTHKTAALLSKEGLNVVGLPKTIDNDIWGTDMTFGFYSAVDVATECIDRLATTAASHRRTMVIEIMGNKTGWLTLYAGVAAGADVILIPEIPFDLDKVVEAVAKRTERKKAFCIVAAAEGAIDKREAALDKKERERRKAAAGGLNASARIAAAVSERLQNETRVVVPGHIQRGGGPSPLDRALCTEMGVYAARLVYEKRFGVTVATTGGALTANRLADIAGKTKFVPAEHELVRAARSVGVSFGD
ncbi:ATP-dependent 6-phosphofructokinase [Clostridia bacterium]|nr:ATP-dependent 6-phosphofructokinase [Clostridia bacterium]